MKNLNGGKIPITAAYYDSEPDIQVVGGPLYQAYKKCLEGDWQGGEKLAVAFLGEVFHTRPYEMSTKRFMRKGRRQTREETGRIREAAKRRWQEIHLPVIIRFIQKNGWAPRADDEEFSAWLEGDRVYVRNGKNRASILAAMGHKYLPKELIVEQRKYLDRMLYDRETKRLQKLPNGFWKRPEARWPYHELAVDWLKVIDPEAFRVLEIGTLGISLMMESQTLDYNANPHWDFPRYNPTYRYDVRNTPWPFKDDEFQVVVALRLWHWLYPMQKAAFQEARRVSKYVMLICPEPEDNLPPRAWGVSREDFIDWWGGPPIKEKAFAKGWGRLYLFGREAL